MILIKNEAPIEKTTGGIMIDLPKSNLVIDA